MINWIPLVSVEQLPDIVERSTEVPCFVFKHSISCPISALSKHRLEHYWDLAESRAEFYFLDLIRHRDVSNLVAGTFQVRHESPQVLLIRNGQCVYHASHLDITAGTLQAQLNVPADL